MMGIDIGTHDLAHLVRLYREQMNSPKSRRMKKPHNYVIKQHFAWPFMVKREMHGAERAKLYDPMSKPIFKALSQYHYTFF